MITVGLYGIPDTTAGDRPTYVHDHGIALMRDGEVLTVVQLERWTGRKHDSRLPHHINAILAALLPPDEPVRFVCANSFLGSTFLSADGNLRIEPAAATPVSADLIPARVRWFPDGRTPRRAEGFIISHELAHIASLLPFVGRFEDGSVAAHVDGGASDSSSSLWAIEQGRPVLIEHSWSRLKEVVNNFNASPLAQAILNAGPEDHLSTPGKLMGYAAWGTARPEQVAWLVSQGWFLDHRGGPAALLGVLRERLGADLTWDARDRRLQDLAAAIQQGFEDAVVSVLSEHGAAHGASTLYYAGGAALNIPTNARLEQHFERVFVPPCPNDSGLALGAAAWLEYCERGALPQHSPFLNRFGLPTQPPEHHAIPEVAHRLAGGQIIGVCNGAGEIGPRALGHRSLLARPDDPALRSRLSEGIKRREWYRPLAPILTAERAAAVLGSGPAEGSLARWMLGAYPILPAWQAPFRGVLHTNGTVRPQVVHPGHPDDAWMHALLTCLWQEHGIPGLINTSFNVRGQPIVHRHEDAAALGQRMELDAVVVHGSLR